MGKKLHTAVLSRDVTSAEIYSRKNIEAFSERDVLDFTKANKQHHNILGKTMDVKLFCSS